MILRKKSSSSADFRKEKETHMKRKLTEDADLDREFVADSRLWKQVLKSQAAGELA
jgi:hypothetical protein